MDESQTDAYVSFNEVQKSYDGENLVVKDLNLGVQRGEFMTMLGPSGSGKTTCLMMLAGFETATSGEIMLDGTAINDVPPWKRDIGIVFQNYALFPHMTVRENLAYPLEVRKTPKSEIEERANKALGMVQLEGFSGRRPGQLSGGQQQRVAIARSLAKKPKLLLGDELTGNLDTKTSSMVMEVLVKACEAEGITTVFVTHDESLIKFATRVIRLDSGIVISDQDA